MANLLTQGFPDRTVIYWTRALARLAERASPEGAPRFGYLLEAGDAPVGVLLLIHTAVAGENGPRIRCNISSWYTQPDHRGFASLLIAAALRDKSVTYVNISPKLETWPVIEAQGFRRFCEGQMLTLPALGPIVRGARVGPFDPAREYGTGLSEDERTILADHAALGCNCFVVEDGDARHPFVFLPRRIMTIVPTMQLAWCRSLDDYVRYSGALGRALLRGGAFTVMLDAEDAVPGLVGKFFRDRGPKYYKGPDRPRLGDLAYTEAVLFGA